MALACRTGVGSEREDDAVAWTWRYEDDSGAAVEPGSSGEPVPAAEDFPNQADAESWLGEVWRELLDAGVHQVVLYDGDRKVYGPMGLAAD